MRSLIKYLKKYRIYAFLGPLFKLIEAGFELTVPIIVAAIIDKGIGQNNVSAVWKYSIILVLLGFAGLFFSVTAQYFSAKAAVGFATDLRHAMYEKIQTLSYSQIDKCTTASLITRMTGDLNALQNGVNLVLRLFLRSPFIVFGAAIMAFSVSVRLSLIFVLVIVLLFAVVITLMALSIPMHKRVRQKTDVVLEKTRENLTGARVIRAFCSEDNEIAEYDRQSDFLEKLQALAGKISALMNPVTYVIVNLGIIFLISRSSVSVFDGAITVGAMIALYNYMTQILVELIKLANLIVNVSRSFSGASRIAAVLDTGDDETADESDTDHPGKVSFENVSLKYESAGDFSLEGITFTANEGETVGIIGSTGSGKTSLINLIPAFYTATEGHVSVDGIDTKAWDKEKLRRKIGIVPQKAVLFSGTVRDNIKAGSDITDEEITEALKLSQSYGFISEKDGLDTEVKRAGANFSGGQKQRLTLARALARRPEILILDDSSSALDFKTDAEIREAIRNLPYNPTVFIVTQRASSVMHADKIILLEGGRIIAEGKHAKLLEASPVYREIYETQFAGGDGNE